MSIIYDALRKTQQNRSQSIQVIQTPASWGIKSILVLITFTLISAAAYINLHRKIPAALPAAKNVAVIKTTKKPLPKLALGGVFVSGKERVAMINNHLLHEGEMIEGAKIVAIHLNKVQLKNGHDELILR